MAQEVDEQLRLVNKELIQVQEQLDYLLERQETLLEQQTELQCLLDSMCDASKEGNNSVRQKDAAESSEKNWTGPFRWNKEADSTLLNVFGISSYRTNQREIVNAVLSGKDVVVIMAAGGGKSLCYQLPALLSNGTTLIVSPLLSLIQDQVMGLTALGIPAAMLTSVTSKEQEKTVYKSLEKGESELKLLYVTPEKIAKSKRFMSKLEKCNHAGRLSIIAIDEAHCCSQWGHDFRPDYKNLGILKKQFPKVPMIALTATATARVQNDLREMLQIRSCVKFVSSINRPNLFYEVREKSPNAQNVISEIANFIKQSYKKKDSGIVYCYSRKECEQVAKELGEQGIAAAYYHADMEPHARSAVHHRWSSNKLQVIVGTVAFGMGINKPDVRFVIHHSLSKSLETYYQESGRAGRDGLPSHCLLYFKPADLPRHSSMVFHEHAGLTNLYSMVRFCQLKNECRRAAFFKHFGEQRQECNGMCDNCVIGGDIAEKDVTAHAQSIVLAVKEMEDCDKKVTLLQLVDLWKSRAHQAGQTQTDLQLAKDVKKQEVEQIILQLLLDGVLKEVFQHTAYATNSYVALGSLYQSLLHGKRKVKLEFRQGIQTAGIHVGSALQAILDCDLARELDRLRDSLAQQHNEVFPYTILSSQQIAQLTVQKPRSVAQIEKLLGKRKTDLFGKNVLDTIIACLSKNPDCHTVAGDWVSPKDVTSLDVQKAGKRKTMSSASMSSSSAKKNKQTDAERSKERTKTSKKDKADDLICIEDSASEDDDFA
ncbi:hypothetical protein GOP47_0013676 [Adiantum capillus-veneris]|uniref:ATP-dependent DNA helicase n=1 Tax=Adiantum capillus-veneris TaxID=13818 RepID=A0A9D4ZFK2_ADICA|nr:hypothetical protein GOP47_0013676 [Adiantum capillus-veneris]